MDEVHALRYVSDKLSTARREQLPRVVPGLLGHILQLSEILNGRVKNPQIKASSTAVVHKYKTQISSLLQDKTVQGRWAAVVLIKTTLESVIQQQEGWDFLQASVPWIRGTLAILNKPDPVTTKTMAILLLTRIFLLTHGQPALTREVTTPHLTPFITAVLNLVTIRASNQHAKLFNSSNPLLPTILQCLVRLLPNHPAAFRPFTNQLRTLLGPLLAPTPSDLANTDANSSESVPQNITIIAQKLHALLPICAAKNGSGDDWKRSVNLILKQIGQTADAVFRAVHSSQTYGIDNDSSEPSNTIADELALPGWSGVSAGCERLVGVLHLLSAYVSSRSNIVYQLPVKSIYDACDKLLSLSRYGGASTGQSEHSNDLVNRSFSKEERETLYMLVPGIHAATLQVFSLILSRMSVTSFSIAEDILEQTSWMAQKANLSSSLRHSVYQLIHQIIELIGPSLSSEKSASLNQILRLACKDLLQEAPKPQSASTVNGKQQTTQFNADSFTPGSNQKQSVRRAPKFIQDSAVDLLCTAMLRVNAPTLSKVRPEIESVAVLLQHEELQLATILNPGVGANVVPFLSKNSPLTESIIHRRVVPLNTANIEDSSSDSEMEDMTEQAVTIPMVQNTSRSLADNFEPSGLSLEQRGFIPSHNSVSVERTPDRVLTAQPAQNDTIPGLDAELHRPAVQPTVPTMNDTIPAEVQMEDAEDESDGSFEIPEIHVGESSDEEEEEE